MKPRFLVINATPKQTPWATELVKTLSSFGEFDFVQEENISDRYSDLSDYLFVVFDEVYLTKSTVSELVSAILSSDPYCNVYVGSTSSTWKRARTAFEAGAIDYIELMPLEELPRRFEIMVSEAQENKKKNQKTTILFADNEPFILDSYSKLLERNGYIVLRANNPKEAGELLEENPQVELGIFDMRLENNNDSMDESGIHLAHSYSHRIKTIILTQYPDQDSVRTALKGWQDRMPASKFLAKDEGPKVLIDNVKNLLSSDG